MLRILKKTSKILKTMLLLTLIFFNTQISVMNTEVKNDNSNLNKTLDLTTMALKYDEIIKKDLYNPIDVYNGRLTAYAADCPLCGGKLGCNGQNVLDGTTTYDDYEYGNINIVASSNLLPCGSIVEFRLDKLSTIPITAIVLDRGVGGTSLDLLVESEDYARNNIGSINISYNILRVGYNR